MRATMSNNRVCAVSIEVSYDIVSAKNYVCVLYVGGPIEDKLY
jgi:hypothetical protein